MRILVIAESLNPENGWGTIARHTVTGLQERGHTVFALLHEATARPICKEMTGLPAATAAVDSRLARWKTARRERKAIRKWKPDVLHVAVEPYALGLPMAGRFRRLPPWLLILLGTYTVLPFEYRSTRGLMQKVYKKAGALLACSMYTRDRAFAAIETHCGAEFRADVEKRTELFRLGTDERPTERSASAKGEPKRVLFVGMVKPRKGVLELVQACAAFKGRSSVPFHLDIIGDFREEHPYIRQIRETIRNRGLETNVTLRGHVSRSDVEEAYNRADLFAMLSKPDGINFEGFGMVFLEANARGIPVIGPNGSGCREAIDDGISGYVADPDDAEAVAERMRRILEENRIRAEDCRAWAKKHSIGAQTAAFEAAYLRMRPIDA